MKHKILSVLSVFMSVLISTAALAACGKTPAEADGGSGIEEKSGVSDENNPLLMTGDYVELDVHKRIMHIAIDTNGAIIC